MSRKALLLFAASFIGMAAVPHAVAAPAATNDDAALPAAFADSEVAAKIRGRRRVALPIEGLYAWPSRDDGPAWYVDTESGVAGTREGLFRLVKGRLRSLDENEVRAFRRDVARRLVLPQKFQRTFGDGRAESKRDLVLLTAWDCEGCSWLQEQLRDHAAQLEIRIHYVIGTLDDEDPDARHIVRALTCADDPVAAYWRLDEDEDAALPEPAKGCAGQGDTFGYISTLLGAHYSPWLVDKTSGEVVPFGALESHTIVRLLNRRR